MTTSVLKGVSHVRPGLRARKLVPTGLQPVARSAYLKLGSATAGLRMEPGFMVIGGQRCGTTSIFKALAEHPQILRPAVEKGIDYFSLYYDRGPAWYRGNFPVQAGAARTRKSGEPVASRPAPTTCSTRSRWSDRAGPPGCQLVAMLRDPVERAFSAYKHELARGFETEASFDVPSTSRSSGWPARLSGSATDPTYESLSHRHQAYRNAASTSSSSSGRSHLFPREQVHVMESEAFFGIPRASTPLVGSSASGVTHRSASSSTMPGPSSPIRPRFASDSSDHYAPYDERLTQLLGRPPHWARQSSPAPG